MIGAGSRQNKKHLETARIDNDFEELWGSGAKREFFNMGYYNVFLWL